MTKRTLNILAAVLAAAALAGCWQAPSHRLEPLPQQPAAGQADRRRQADHLQQASIDYEAEPDRQADDAVKTALMWAEKAKEALDRVVRLQNENRSLEQTNKRLLEQVAKLQTELAQAQNELRDANELLLDMRQDLDRWKANVLGFRDELRTANKVQLDALRQVIVLLGGQPAVPPTQKESAKAEKTSGEPGA